MAMYTFRTMKPSEHCDNTWGALFDCPDAVTSNYAVVAGDCVVEDLLTFEEAKERAAYLEANDDTEEDWED